MSAARDASTAGCATPQPPAGARLTAMSRTDLEQKPLPPDPVIEAYKKDVDRTLLRENLKRSVEERLRDLMRLQRFAEEWRRAGERAFR